VPRAVILALCGGRTEADYPDERAWIGGKPRNAIRGTPIGNAPIRG